MKLTFEGLMAPVFTPFSLDGQSVVLKDIPAYAQWLSKNGINGVLVNGTSGEGMSLTLAERKATTEAWIAAAAKTRIHVQVQVGGTNMQDVLHLARHAEEVGANSLLCLPELFNKPANIEELVDYLAMVANAASKTPILYYHNPGYTAVSLNMPAFMSLAAERINTFAGVKYTDNNLEMGSACANLQGGAFSVFLGCDSVMSGAFALGFTSSIATSLNVLPALCVGILQSIQQGKLADARDAQDRLNQAIGAMTKNGTSKWVPALKAAMTLVSGLDMGPTRAPLRSLADHSIQAMRKDLSALKLL